MRLAAWSLAICLFGFSTVALADDPKVGLKISLAEARKIALERVPGTILREKLRTTTSYSFKIQPRDSKRLPYVFVHVDGNTAAILRVKEAKRRSDRPGD